MSEVIGHSTRSLLREKAQPPGVVKSSASRSLVRTTVHQKCEDCRAITAYHAWHALELTPSFNWEVSFADYGIPPAGGRAVIELVTAQILVPEGEWARLRMYTSIGELPSNIDLFLTFQGNVTGQAVYVATHAIRAYSDGPIEFDINRDNGETSGQALICISGYLGET
jgi:hypothetical protein